MTGDAPRPDDQPGFATTGDLTIIERRGRDAAPPVPENLHADQPPTDRDRPTVVLDTRRPPPDAAVSPAVAARLERMENSPFWTSEPEPAVPDHRPARRRRSTAHSPAGPLAGLVTLSLLAAFFGWVSAEPFWLAAGHGSTGQATTVHCRGEGLGQQCTGRFTSTAGRTVTPVTLLGVEGPGRAAGAVTPARMVSPDSGRAYAGPTGTLMHLRWVLGFLLVLICGYGIAQTTGAHRLDAGTRRRRAVLLSFAGPILLQLGFLAAAF